jgi:ribonuclease Z
MYSFDNNGESLVVLEYAPKKVLTLRGYSRGGERTSILIEELNVVFDMGYLHNKAHSYDNIIISHGHADHYGALHLHHCSRRLNKNFKQKIYIMPEYLMENFKMLATCISFANCGMSGKIEKSFETLINTSMLSADECMTSNNHLLDNSGNVSTYTIKSYVMKHKIRSFGYIISQLSKRLKPEFIGKPPGVLKHISANVKTHGVLTPIVGYSGDTSIEVILIHPDMLSVPVLILECTFCDNIDDVHTESADHIDFNDIEENYDLFNNKCIVLFHLSQKFKAKKDILEIELRIDNLNLKNPDKKIFLFC